jgi:hypothetical protein
MSEVFRHNKYIWRYTYMSAQIDTSHKYIWRYTYTNTLSVPCMCISIYI